MQQALSNTLVPHFAVVIPGKFHRAFLALAERLAKCLWDFTFPIVGISVNFNGHVFQFAGAFR